MEVLEYNIIIIYIYTNNIHDVMIFFTILGEALGGISRVYDWWAQLRVDVGRRQCGGVGSR